MRRLFIPTIEWNLFKGSFEKNLTIFNVDNPKEVMKKAKKQYYDIIKTIPQFKKNDVLLTTILNSAILASVYLSLPQKFCVEIVEEYYRKSMNNQIMKLKLKKNKNFTRKYQYKLSKDSMKSQKATNPYTWRFKFVQGETLDSFDVIFNKCGICELYKRLGIFEIVPALCAYDYDMAKQTNAIFTRDFKIANGDKICDCHYRKNLDWEL